jgi:hypothetical protein
MPGNQEFTKGAKKSKLAPAFEVKPANPYGLKHMMPEEKQVPVTKKVTMETTPIDRLTNVSPIGPMHKKGTPWKPKGREQ